MMYDAVVEQMIEAWLVHSSDDYLNANTPEEKEKMNIIFRDSVDRAIKLISVQDERTKEADKLEASKLQDAEELKLKLAQLHAAQEKDLAEMKFKIDTYKQELKKANRQMIVDGIKFGVSIGVASVWNWVWNRLDAEGFMFTTAFGKRKAEESTKFKI